MLTENVDGGAVPLWLIGAVATSAAFLLVLDTLADAKGAVGIVARVRANLARSKLFMRFRRHGLAGACVLCASGIGWNVGITKASEVLSLHLQTSITSGWVDWLQIDSDILQSTAPWWLGCAIALASIGLAVLGRVAGGIRDCADDDELRSRIIIPTTYRSRRP
jgi:dipeptide/tripeptide permease